MNHPIIKGIFYSLIVLLGLCSISCDRINCHPEKRSFSFQEQKMIELNTFFFDTTARVVVGSLLVFEYEYQIPQCNHIDADEWMERIHFEVDPSLDSFFFTGQSLLDSKCFLYEDGHLAFEASFFISAGSIHGLKLSESLWKVDADLSVNSVSLGGKERAISFEGEFELR